MKLFALLLIYVFYYFYLFINLYVVLTVQSLSYFTVRNVLPTLNCVQLTAVQMLSVVYHIRDNIVYCRRLMFSLDVSCFNVSGSSLSRGLVLVDFLSWCFKFVFSDMWLHCVLFICLAVTLAGVMDLASSLLWNKFCLL